MTLFIFVDESGNFDFSQNGTKYFVLTGVCTLNPLSGRDGFSRIKYNLLSCGKDTECFHASYDNQSVRDKVFAEIKNITDIEIHSVIADKRKAHPSLYKTCEQQILSDGSRIRKVRTKRVEEKFYRQICDTLLRYIVRRFLEHKEYKEIDITEIVVILDKIFHSKKRELVKKYIKQSIGNQFKIIPYIYFHQMKSDFNCQICDYCCWAISAKWSRKEMRPYNEIKSRIVNEIDLFESESTQYY